MAQATLGVLVFITQLCFLHAFLINRPHPTASRDKGVTLARQCVMAEDPPVALVLEGGPLRWQIAQQSKGLFGSPMKGYVAVRDDMKRAFAAAADVGTIDGYITSAALFGQLMQSVGA